MVALTDIILAAVAVTLERMLDDPEVEPVPEAVADDTVLEATLEELADDEELELVNLLGIIAPQIALL